MNEPYHLLTKIRFAALLTWQPEILDQIFKDGSRNNFSLLLRGSKSCLSFNPALSSNFITGFSCYHHNHML